MCLVPGSVALPVFQDSVQGLGFNQTLTREDSFLHTVPALEVPHSALYTRLLLWGGFLHPLGPSLLPRNHLRLGSFMIALDGTGSALTFSEKRTHTEPCGRLPHSCR